MSVTRVPHFADGETPVSLEDTHAVVSKMQTHLEAGRNVVVHCKAGLGRTGTTLRTHPRTRAPTLPPHTPIAHAHRTHVIECELMTYHGWGVGTGLITGCCLKALGVSGEEALARVHKARNGTCYQANQQHYLLNSFLPAAPSDRQNA